MKRKGKKANFMKIKHLFFMQRHHIKDCIIIIIKEVNLDSMDGIWKIALCSRGQLTNIWFDDVDAGADADADDDADEHFNQRQHKKKKNRKL